MADTKKGDVKLEEVKKSPSKETLQKEGVKKSKSKDAVAKIDKGKSLDKPVKPGNVFPIFVESWNSTSSTI